VQGNEGGEERRRCESTGGLQLADGCIDAFGRQRRSGPSNSRKHERTLFGIHWPSRPGEPQHEWEAPRLTQFGMGDAVDGLARRICSRANKAALRMVGNGWCYPIPKIIYQWIVNAENVS
jgi:hypothetical protein